MRLLLATDAYLPDQGGSQRVILETSTRLQARGHDVAILTFTGDTDLPRQDEVAGVRVCRLPLSGKLSIYPRALLDGRRAVRSALRAAQYDVMHIHLPLIGLGAVINRDSRRLPCVYSFYGPWHQEMAVELNAKPLSAPAGLLYRPYVNLICRALKAWQGRVMRRCDRLTVLSEYSRQQVVHDFPAVDPSRVVLIPGGVDVDRFHPVQDQAAVRSRLGLPQGKTILLAVRRLVPRMGLENLLHAFARLCPERPDLTLVIGGRGRLEGPLCDLAAKLGVTDRVRFAGYISEEDLPAYYQAADLFVLPTVALEGFGLITLEALASGLPVVGTPVGSTVELLGRFDRRLLMAGNDAQAIADGIGAGLCLVQREGHSLAERCRAFAVAHYDWERVVDHYEDLYRELVETAHAP